MLKNIFILTLLSSTIHAAEVSAPPLGILGGVGFALKTNNRINNNASYRGGDAIFLPLPVVIMHYGPLMIGANGITLSFIGDREKSAFLNLAPQGDKYYAEGMQDRKESLFWGVGARYKQYSLTLSHDLSHRSHGTKLGFNYSRMFLKEEQSYFRGTFSLDLYNQTYADYYYGVKSTEATSTRSAYTAKAYLEPGVGIVYIRKLHDKLSLSTGISIKKYSRSIIDSPTTKNTAFEFANFTGLTWTLY